MRTTRTALYQLADLAYGGRLDAQLEAWRSEGVTLDEQSRLLHAKNITVSRETLRRWHHAAKAAA